MEQVRDKLQTYLAGPTARTLAKLMPAALLAGTAGASLGAVLGLPGFVNTPEGFIIGGLAINVASTWLTELAMLPLTATNHIFAR